MSGTLDHNVLDRRAHGDDAAPTLTRLLARPVTLELAPVVDLRLRTQVGARVRLAAAAAIGRSTASVFEQAALEGCSAELDEVLLVAAGKQLRSLPDGQLLIVPVSFEGAIAALGGLLDPDLAGRVILDVQTLGDLTLLADAAHRARCERTLTKPAVTPALLLDTAGMRLDQLGVMRDITPAVITVPASGANAGAPAQAIIALASQISSEWGGRVLVESEDPGFLASARIVGADLAQTDFIAKPAELADDTAAPVTGDAADHELAAGPLTRDPLTGALDARSVTVALAKQMIADEAIGAASYALRISLTGLDDLIAVRGATVRDLILRQVAWTIEATMREEDNFGRIDGEFAVILAGCATRLGAERFRQRLTAAWDAKQGHGRVQLEIRPVALAGEAVSSVVHRLQDGPRPQAGRTVTLAA
jgi:GGDEF domain-containing protein